MAYNANNYNQAYGGGYNQFDKRTKPASRKTVDYYAAMIRHMEVRLFKTFYLAPYPFFSILKVHFY